jgi:tetratricopeptide (TPR) repeat protein
MVALRSRFGKRRITTITDVARRVEPKDSSLDAAAGDELLRLALSRPKQAADVARDWLSGPPDPLNRSYALQTLSIVHRELGDGAQALRYVRRALRAAEKSGRHDRSSDVRATLGSTLALVGRTREALDAFDRSLKGAHGLAAARILMRRGGVLQILGRYDDALADLRRAIPVLRDASDTVYEARALTFRALVYLELASHTRSDIDFARGEELLRNAGQQLESAVARHNRAIVAYRSGDLPGAMRQLDAAERFYIELGQPTAELELDRCRVLLSGGMPDDAWHHAGLAVEILARNTSTGHQHAEALLTAASAGLAAGDVGSALADADAATRLFRLQHRDRWVLRAQRTALSARWLGGERSTAMLRTATEVAERLEVLRDPETVDARLLAGRIALALGSGSDARGHLEAAARARHRGAAISRATGWLARALQAEAAGDSRAMLASCRRGLDLLDEHRLTLGATEMRARASVHGAELAALATRHAARVGNPTQLLLWSERWRATALTAAPVRPPDDEELANDLSALRGVTRRIAELRADGASTTGPEKEQAKLEAVVRGRMLRTSGGTSGLASAPVDVRRIRAALGTTTLVELVEVDGTLLVVTVGLGGTKMREVGSAARAEDELDFARYGLRRAAMSTSSAGRRLAMSSLETNAASLQEALLGPAAEHLGSGEVVIIPSGRLHAVPWSLLPALRDRTVTVAPSVSSWLRATSTPKPTHDKVALVAGPGLETDGAEVHDVAARYPGADLLTGDAATAENVLAALEGSSLAHIAAHGTFRADNALFSSLRLADGELTVHDLERLRNPPHRLVLSSCDSGLGAHAGADELLGLTNALIGLGTAGLLASVVPVNDAATVPLMVAVHGRLREGATLAQALHQARRWLGASDIVVAATGLSFVALGGA